MAVASVTVARAVESVWAGFAACVALILCLWRMWLPIQYEFGPRGIIQHFLGRQQRIAWRDIVRCEFKRQGFVLHASDDATAIGTLRSIFIRYPSQHQQLRELIELEMSRSSLRASSSIETMRQEPKLEFNSPSKSAHSDSGSEPPPPFVIS